MSDGPDDAHIVVPSCFAKKTRLIPDAESCGEPELRAQDIMYCKRPLLAV
jgi:hypothetical protein